MSDAILSALTPAGLIDALIRDEDRVSRAMIDACTTRGDAMLDQLEPLIMAEALPEDLTTGEWWLRLHAAMILGQMPSERAGRLLVDLMEWLDDADDSNLMDWLAGKWPALFRNKPDAVREPLRALAEDRRHGWYIRIGAVEAALAFDEARGEDAHERAIDWAARIVADETEDWDLRLCAGSELLDRPRERHRLLLDDLGERQAGGIAHFTLDEVRRSYENPGPPPWREHFANPWSFYSPSQIAGRQERWAKEAAESDRFETPEVRVEPKVGRNEPCPCGSGRKYKKCCLAKREAVSDDELAWRRLRAAIDEHRPALMAFIRRAYGSTALAEAWDDSFGRSGIPFDPDDRGATLFLPWFCNVWSPDAGHTTVGDASLHGVVPAAAYLQRAKRVDPTFRSYVESCLAAPFSVFEILDAAPGEGFRIRDLILGTEHDVSERSASTTMRRGDLVIGQFASAGGVTMLEASQSFVIPPIRKLDAIALRKRLFPSGQPTAAELRAEHLQIIAFYLEIEHRLFDPPMPALTNTDGDELSLRRVVFDVPSAEEAFDALKHLALADNDSELLYDAQRDSAGTLANVQFSWLRLDSPGVGDSGNTVLGSLAIRGGRLTVEVNSEARELRIRGIVADALGERARYRVTELVSMDEMPSFAPSGGAVDGFEDLASMPEVAGALRTMLARHYDGWVHESIPALGGRTPMEAVRDADGREAVMALVDQIERDGERMTPPLDPGVTRSLRKRLGL